MALKHSKSYLDDNNGWGSGPRSDQKLAMNAILSPRKDHTRRKSSRKNGTKDVKLWSIEEVGIWLESFDLHDSKTNFIENEISGAELLTLTDEDLVSIGITKMGPRKKILRKIDELNTATSPNLKSSQGSDGSVGLENILVKLNFEGEIRKQKFRLTAGIRHLRKAIISLFENELQARNFSKESSIPLQIKYIDEEKDVITVEDDDGVQVAFNFAIRSRSTLTFIISAPGKTSLRSSASSATLAMYSLFENLTDPIIVIDHFGITHYVNNPTEKLTGFSAKELKGRNINILMTGADKANHDTYIKNFVASGKTKLIGIGKDVVLQRKDSTLLPIHLDVSARVLEGKPFFVGLLKKFCDEPQAKSILQQERTVLDSLHMPAVISDVVGTILHFNKSAEKFFGYSLTETVGKNVKILMTDRHAAKHDAYLERYARTGESKLIGIGRRVTTRHKDGILKEATLALSEKKGQDKVYYIAVFKEKEYKAVG